MTIVALEGFEKPRLEALLDHFSTIEDPREPWRVKDDLSRLRKGHGAQNMAIVRHFALNLIRAVHDKRSIKLRRKKPDGAQTISPQSSDRSVVNSDSKP